MTRYTEGLNEHGLCILSASLAVKDDEKELSAASPRDEDYSSPDGKKIRNALLCKTPELAVESLQDLMLRKKKQQKKIQGNSYMK